MAQYVDGFVIPVPATKLSAYRRMAQKASKVWKDHGALDYKEAVIDEVKSEFARSFPEGIKAKSGETIVFSWITFKSKAHRNRVNAKVMKDPRLNEMCDPKAMPFDCKRMLYGGFKVMVSI